MTAIAQDRERAEFAPKPTRGPPAPATTPDQAKNDAVSRPPPPGSGSNGQQASHVATAIPESPAAFNGQRQPVPTAAPTYPSAAADYRELRVFAELFADVQQTRVACQNRAERGGLDPIILGPYFKGLEQTEHQLKLAMVRCYRRVVDPSIRQWQEATTGIGDHTLARLLGAIGHPRHAIPHHWEGEGDDRVLIADPPFERNLAKLWAYCGHGDPARRRRKGMTAEEGAALGNPRAKMLVHLLAEASMKCVGTAAKDAPAPEVYPQSADAQGAGSVAGKIAESGALPRPTRARSPYRDVYDQARATYADRTDDDGKEWTPARQHAAALRLVGKEILRDLWLAAGGHDERDSQALSAPGGYTNSEPQPWPAAGGQP